MIKKLRNKFILITMLLVTAVLIAVFIVMLFSNYNLFKKESHDEMMRAIDAIASDGSKSFGSLGQSNENPPKSPKPNSTSKPPASTPKTSSAPDTRKHTDKKRSAIDVFTILADHDTGEIISFDMGNSSISDEEFDIAFKTALSSSGNSGTIRSISLRFMKRTSAIGDVYAFADMTSETAALQQQALVMLFAGIGGLLAFFLITLLLSNLAMKPTIESYTRQKQFIADASHELRTPLTVILANTSILSKNADTDDEKKWIDSTYSEGLRMKQLIDDMLFLARSDAQELPTDKETISFSDTVWSCVLPFESVLLEKDVTLSTDDIDSDISVFANEVQLKQLITILFDNACKYVDNGGRVSVSLKKDVDNKAILKINNTGSIISEEDLPHIFERFYRADKVRTFMGGYGLGLSIAQQIIKQHNGRIAATSSEAEGTTFTVTLSLTQKRKYIKK